LSVEVAHYPFSCLLILEDPGSGEGLAFGSSDGDVDGVLGEVTGKAVFFLTVLGEGGKEGGREGGRGVNTKLDNGKASFVTLRSVQRKRSGGKIETTPTTTTPTSPSLPPSLPPYLRALWQKRPASRAHQAN
jgi:hypothetical protein